MQTNQNNWYEIENVNEIDSPALVIYPERVKKNIALIKTMIDDVNRLRPHVKTHKCREASQLSFYCGVDRGVGSEYAFVMCKDAKMQMGKCANMKICECANVKRSFEWAFRFIR